MLHSDQKRKHVALTDADCRAFEHLFRRYGSRWDRLAYIQQHGDRRDAEYMLAAQSGRSFGVWLPPTTIDGVVRVRL